MCCFGPGFFWGGGMWLFPLIMLAVFLFVIYTVFRRGDHKPPWMDHNRSYDDRKELESPLEILKKRYAKGEITKDEFERMKKDLLS